MRSGDTEITFICELSSHLHSAKKAALKEFMENHSAGISKASLDHENVS